MELVTTDSARAARIAEIVIGCCSRTAEEAAYTPTTSSTAYAGSSYR